MAQDYQARFVQDGAAVDHTPFGADVAAGQVVVVGARAMIARTPILDGKLGALATGGMFDIVKAQESISDGAAIHWDADGDPYGGTAGTGCATATSTANTFLGFAVGAAAETAEVARVNLVGVASVTNVASLGNTIADPGDAGAIPVAASGCCMLTSADAETRTLAIPTSVGQMLLLAMDTDGGDCVLTIASAVNETGNNTLTFDDAGETILLIAMSIGGTKTWRVLGNDGVGLSTV